MKSSKHENEIIFFYLSNFSGFFAKLGRHFAVNAVKMEVDKDCCATSPGDPEEPIGEPVVASELLCNVDNLWLNIISLSHNITEFNCIK